MSPEAKIIDIEPIRTPISEDAPSGVNVKPLGVYDDIKALRVTEDAMGPAGSLRAGEFKTANWPKVITMCTKELGTRTKDLQLVVWLAEALGKVHGFKGIVEGLEVLQVLHDGFWATYYPLLDPEESGLDIRAGLLTVADKLLVQALDNCLMTTKVEGEDHRYWEWNQVQILATNAGRASGDDKETLMAEASTKRDALEKAVAKTTWEFYNTILESIIGCEALLSPLRDTIDKLFREDPGYYDMEEVGAPGFSDFRKALTECKIKVEGILHEKPVPAGRVVAGAEPEITGDVSGDPSSPQQTYAPGSMSADPMNRADALNRLSTIAAFFQRTEPHSPVAYLVNRAVKWGEMPLENWLEEVIGDMGVVNTIRSTLGLEKKSEY